MNNNNNNNNQDDYNNKHENFINQAELLVNDYIQGKLDNKINALNNAISKHNAKYNSKFSNNNYSNDYIDKNHQASQQEFLNTARQQMLFNKEYNNNKNYKNKNQDMTNLVLNICLICTMSMIMVLVYQICF